MRYPFLCNNDSFDGIFSEHVIEHFYIDDVRHVLQECYRILKSQCYIRLSLPDLFCCVQEYLISKENPKSAYLGAECVRLLTQEYLHLSVWDFDRMAYELDSIGFVDIKRCQFGEGRDKNIIFDLEVRKSESFYIEAKKP